MRRRRRAIPALCLPAVAAVFWPCPLARAMDLRLDVATDNNSGDDTAWFGASQLPYLNFPSPHGHNIEQGNASHQAALTAAGNSLGVYYDYFHTLYSPSTTPAAAAATIQGWIQSQFGSPETNLWLVLNEVDSSTWNSSTSGAAYRTWLVNTMAALNSAGYKNILLFTPQSLASKTYSSTWQSIAQYAYVGAETFIDGQTVVKDNFSVATLQAQYQSWYNAWTNPTTGVGLSPSKLFATEHFSVNKYAASNYWGANGISGTQWQAAIEARDLAIHNIPFGGFIGYAWDKNAQATGDPATDLAAQISYEKAYASTLTVQTEIPAWTGNDGTSSWADYLNWTGGLPSTTQAPYPLLAATNPTLPKQTAANFLGAATSGTTITLDGNQSVTTLSFDSSRPYTLAPGTGGTLTLTGAGATVTVSSSFHVISAPLTLASNVAVNLTGGSLTLTGTLTNSGVAFAKSGTGSLTIRGAQSNSPGSSLSVSAGTLFIFSDAGSPTSATLALSSSGGSTILNASQHLASLSLTGGTISLRTLNGYLLTHSLSVSGTGTLDLAQNDLILDYTGLSPLASIRSALATGYNAGTWTGPGIITSVAPTHPNMSLAYAEAFALFSLTGAQTATWDAQPVDATTLLLKYTLAGDANLDGAVNADDYALIDKGFVQHASTWWLGDFNYDGQVDQNDYLLIDTTYLQQQGGSPSPAFLAQRQSQFGPDYVSQLLTSIPEPTLLSPLCLLPLLLFRQKSKQLH